MRIVILGGGVVGITAAYELQKDGHEVVVVDKNRQVGVETSWGNAGMIAPGHSFAWSSPHAPMIMFKSLFSKNQSIRFRPSLDARLWLWSLKFLMQCTDQRSAYNTIRKHRLAVYSQQVLGQTRRDLAIAFDHLDRGILYFYRTEQRLKSGIDHMQILARNGQKIEILDRGQVLALEPALGVSGVRVAGGIFCPSDETGDCNKFTRALAVHCSSSGAEIRLNEQVLGLDVDGDRITGVRTSLGRIVGDAFVLALGNGSAAVARSVGVSLAIYPVKGYSLTIPVGNHPSPPTIGSVDEENLVAISPMGDRVRVTAVAEITGYDTRHKPEDFTYMARVARELYPHGGDHERAEMWAGLRPMTPTNLPIIGRKRHRNLYYNTGHGHIGWTMSHGSARILTDVVAGRAPALPLDSIND